MLALLALRARLAPLFAAVLLPALASAGNCVELEPNGQDDDCASASPLTPAAQDSVLGDGAVAGRDDDWSLLPPVDDAAALVVEVRFDASVGAIEAEVLAPGTCTTPSATAVQTSYGWRFELLGSSAAPEQHLLHVFASPGNEDCIPYTVHLASIEAACSGLVATDDALEDNDTCDTAAPLMPGVHGAFFASWTDHDYYAVDVPPGHMLVVDMEGVANATGNALLRAYGDPGCQNLLDEHWGESPDASVRWGNSSGATSTVYVECAGYASVAFGGYQCLEYLLHVSTLAVPCYAAHLADRFEENDSIAMTPILSDGVHQGLTVQRWDEDWFRIYAEPNQVVTVGIRYDDSLGDIDLGNGTPPSLETPGSEWTTFTGTNNSTMPFYLRIAMDPASTFDCNSYELVVTGADADGILHTCVGDGTVPGCPCGNYSATGAKEGCRNSLGHGARLEYRGSPLLSANNLSLRVSGARPHQSALLLHGLTPVTIPFKDGILCLGNPTMRIEYMQTDAAGIARSTVSLGAASGATPGARIGYQVWYRDPGGSTCSSGSNFTSAVLVYWR